MAEAHLSGVSSLLRPAPPLPHPAASQGGGGGDYCWGGWVGWGEPLFPPQHVLLLPDGSSEQHVVRNATRSQFLLSAVPLASRLLTFGSVLFGSRRVGSIVFGSSPVGSSPVGSVLPRSILFSSVATCSSQTWSLQTRST